MNIDIYSAKADYTHPLKKNAKLELGWKSSYVINDSKANYFDLSGAAGSLIQEDQLFQLQRKYQCCLCGLQ